MFDRMSLALDEASQWIKRGVGRFAGLPRAFRAVPFILKQTPSFAIRRTLREAGSLINLIDRDWYLTCYPDAAAGEMDAVAHYLKVGAALHYDPNPYFSTDWYLAQNPDLGASGLAPIVHFIRIGALQGRDPSPQFHTKWYLNKYPDVAASRTNPLEHFIASGRAESRSPNRFASGTFHSDFFSIDFRENLGRLTEGVSQEPLAAFNARSTNIEDLLPSDIPRCALVDTSTVHVVIPVYRGVAETIRCVESVLASRPLNRTFGKLIVVDDCSPEPALTDYLTALGGREGVIVLSNARNMGFVASINRGIAAGEDGDVILLNNDTEVVGDWVDRLASHARSDARIATVTPFSNNATICSYPYIEGMPNELPTGLTLRQIDRACADVNTGRTVDLPTGVGSCMLVKRQCLREIGGFDEAAFGKGYGEETDFCQRAIQRGWRNVLAADVFVFHVGEVSFSNTGNARRTKATAVMRRRHPSYVAQLAAWMRTDPARSMRVAATAALFRSSSGQSSGRPAILHVLHSAGGGTEKHVAELIGRLGHETVRHLVLVIGKSGGFFSLSLLLFDDPAWRAVEFIADGLDGSAHFLRTFGVTRVHLHHFLNAFEEILPFVHALNVPYDLTIHDYMTICPRIFLLTSEFQYCGEPDEAGCALCLAQGGLKLGTDIQRWRNVGTSLIANAERVICPSADTATRIRDYVSKANIIVVPHEKNLYRPTLPLAPRPLRPGQTLNVALLGNLAEHKGGAYLLDCMEAATRRDLPITWHAIGTLDSSLKARAKEFSDVLRVTGAYDVAEIKGLIERIEPHVVLFSQRWPETYSYTLSEAFAAGTPVLVPEIGAFVERTKGVAWCWTYPVDLQPEKLVDMLLDIRNQIESGASGPLPHAGSAASAFPLQFDFYRENYLVESGLGATRC